MGIYSSRGRIMHHLHAKAGSRNLVMKATKASPPPRVDPWYRSWRAGIKRRSKTVLVDFSPSSFPYPSLPSLPSPLSFHPFSIANFTSAPSRLTASASEPDISLRSYCCLTICFTPLLFAPSIVVVISPRLIPNMPATQTIQPSFPSLPLAMPGKSPYYTHPTHPAPYSRVAISPPQPGSSVNTSAVPSLTSGSYAGSTTGDYDSSNGGNSGIDLVEMLNDRLSNAVDPLPLDRSLARQAQT